MMFCPRCGSILIPDLNKKIIRCNGCNYKEDKNRNIIIKEDRNGCTLQINIIIERKNEV